MEFHSIKNSSDLYKKGRDLKYLNTLYISNKSNLCESSPGNFPGAVRPSACEKALGMCIFL